jgi:hypothetical protein
LEREYNDHGVFDFNEQTAQVRLRPADSRPVEYTPFTDSHSIDAIVREPTSFGEFSASGSYLERHVDIYVVLVIPGVSSCLTCVV